MSKTKAGHTLLSARQVSKVFRRGTGKPVDVLKAVDLEIATGDRIAILGKSGAGKSTLLHILGTLEAPSSGKVFFDGRDLFRFSESDLSSFRNRTIGFVFQFHYLMVEFTALENVMMPALIGKMSKRMARDRAMELLSWVGLTQRADHKPGQLSGGEQQRVAIARALVMKPKLILTDEMTGNLDVSTGSQILELMGSVHEEYGCALVSVTHDEGMAAQYDRVLKLHQGSLSRV
jgi:lipoprotein-releasing system ATP-binding protein